MIRLDVADLGRLVDQLEAGVDDLVLGLERCLADDQRLARLRAAALRRAPVETGLLR